MGILNDFDQLINQLDKATEQSQGVFRDVNALEMNVMDHLANVNTAWVLTAGVLAFFAVVGLAFLENASARVRNTFGPHFQHAAGFAVVVLGWWFTGYAFAFGGGAENRNGFIGNDDIFLVSGENTFPIRKYNNVFFFFVVTAIATLIAPSAVSGRLTSLALLVHAAFFSAFVYPIAAHWLYSDSGFLSPFTRQIGHIGTNGVIDTGFASAHLAGAAAAFAILLFAGARKNRFAENEAKAYETGACTVGKFAGILFLVIGVFGLTTGGTMNGAVVPPVKQLRIVINLIISGGASAAVVFFVQLFAASEFNFTFTANGLLAGLVSASSAAAVVEPWAAFVIGAVGGILYFATKTVISTRYDDAINAIAMQGVPAFWALLSVGIFSTQVSVEALVGHKTTAYGFLYGGAANQFAVQFFAALLVPAWAFLVALVYAAILNGAGALRVAEESDEEKKQQ